MKTRQNISTLSLALIAGLALSAPVAHAQPIASDDFAYTPGASVLGQAGGSGWAGAWQSAGYGDWKADNAGTAYAKDGVQLVTSGKRASTSSGGMQRLLAGPPIGAPGTSLWVSFVAQQTQGAAAGSWLGLKLPCTGLNPFLFLGKSYDADRWGADAGLPGSVRLSGTAASTRALIVARIDFREGADDVAVWINPNPSSEYLLTVNPNLALAQYGDFSGITKVLLETGSLAEPVRGFVDELRLGHAAIDVMPTMPGVASGGARVIPHGQASVARQADGSVLVSNLGASSQAAVSFDLGGLDGQGYSMDLHEFLTSPGAMIRETTTDANGDAAFTSELSSIGDGVYQLNTSLPGGVSSVTVGGASGVAFQIDASALWFFSSSIPCSMSEHAVIHKIWGTREVGYVYWDPITHVGHWVTTGTESYVKWTWRTCEPNLVELADIGPISWILCLGDVVTDGGPDDMDGSLHSLVETQGLTELSFRDMGLHGLGQEIRALGDAVITGGCPEAGDACDFGDRVLTIDNFGGSGDDGVLLGNGFGPALGLAAVSFLSDALMNSLQVGGVLEIRPKPTAADGQGSSTKSVIVPDGPDGVIIIIPPAPPADPIVVGYSVSHNGVVVGSGQSSSDSFAVHVSQTGLETLKWTWSTDQQGQLGAEIETGPNQPSIVVGAGAGALSGSKVTMRLLGTPAVEALGGIEITGRSLVGPLVLTNLVFEPLTPACPADFDGDGTVDFFDYDAFVTAFESGAPGADFDADGTIDFFDYDAFVNAFEAGC
ncbi:MAG: GC-type dockerin domain-anchored protein [Planctomycetota bacterium]